MDIDRVINNLLGVGWIEDKERLDVGELEKLPTKRLLAILKKVRKIRSQYGWHYIIDGNDYYKEDFQYYNNYEDDIKEILKDRPHIPREKKKNNFRDRYVKRNENFKRRK